MSVEINSEVVDVSLDTVRAFLAKWVLSRNEINSNAWLPIVSGEEICSSPNCYICAYTILRSPIIAFDEGRLPTDEEWSPNSWKWAKNTSPAILWECQYVLQQRLSQLKDMEQVSPSNVALIALFICSYPALVMRCENEEEVLNDDSASLKLSIRPVYTPQNIYFSLTVQRSNQEASLKLIAESNEIQFQWENWINAAMAILKTDSQLSRDTRGEYGMQEP